MDLTFRAPRTYTLREKSRAAQWNSSGKAPGQRDLQLKSSIGTQEQVVVQQ